MFNIKINSENVNCSSNELLSKIMVDAGIFLPMNCGGNHTCGKCKVTVISGSENLSPIGEAEKSILSENELKKNIRLACFVTANGDCAITTDSDVSSFCVHTEFIINNDDCDNDDDYVIAVDIGTTTVVSYLYSTKDKSILSTVGELNAQSSYGADVISRIDYTNQNEESKLHKVILDQLKKMFLLNIKNSHKDISLSDISKVVITGNTTMLHFLMDYESSGIAVSPFTPHSLFNESHVAKTLFGDLTNATLYLPPCIGSYVGADMVCAILASKMAEDDGDKTQLLVDIGTNGEMALFSKGKLYTCSTAAGPAFEGAGIKMGMTAKSGAISDVFIKDNKVCYSVIDGDTAKGICGTGLINAVSVFLKLLLIDFSGSINDDESEFSYLVGCDENGDSYINIGDSGVILTGRDIRQVQLAKAAIHAGILTLCHECKININEVDSFFVCGGFGSVINPFSAAEIGLIPKCLAEKSAPLGNGAGLGALMIAKSEKSLDKAIHIAEIAEDIPLSTSPYFRDQYVEQMMFGDDA